MMEYLDIDGKELRKGFYFYLPTNVYDDEIKTPGKTYYFTGEFKKRRGPVFKTFSSSGEVIKILTEDSCRYLRPMNVNQVEDKIKSLEDKIKSLDEELKWHKEKLYELMPDAIRISP